jgi:acyl-CoA thioester hydrolase
MGTFYNSRALEWFECGRTEYLRQIGLPYADMEARGVFLPLTEAHVRFLGRARYDDELKLSVSAGMSGKARVRFDVEIVHAATGDPVTAGHTIHACIDEQERVIRPPAWLAQTLTETQES